VAGQNSHQTDKALEVARKKGEVAGFARQRRMEGEDSKKPRTTGCPGGGGLRQVGILTLRLSDCKDVDVLLGGGEQVGGLTIVGIQGG